MWHSVIDPSRISYGDHVYNVVFGPIINSKIVARPVYTSSRRAIAYIEHELVVDAFIKPGIINPNNNTGRLDSEISEMRRTLLCPRKRLQVSRKGYGNWDINPGAGMTSSSVNGGSDHHVDVLWGPTPVLFDWVPVGGEHVAKVVWGVVWRTSCCENSPTGPLMEFEYTVNRDIDIRGQTTKTIVGHFRIPLNDTWSWNKGAQHTADYLMDSILTMFPVRPRFRRESQKYELSEDRTTITFEIVDRELPGVNAIPPEFADADANISLSGTSGNREGGPLIHWTWTGTANVKPHQYMPIGKSLVGCWSIFHNRLLIMARNLGFGANRSAPIAVALPDRMDVDENIFDHSYTIRISYKLVANITSNNIFSSTNMLAATGFGAPCTADLWDQMYIVARSLWHPRGYSRLYYNPLSDLIVHLCEGYGPYGYFTRGANAETNAEDRSISDYTFEDVDTTVVDRNGARRHSTDYYGVDLHIGAVLSWNNSIITVDDSGYVHYWRVAGSALSMALFPFPLNVPVSAYLLATSYTPRKKRLIMRGSARRLGLPSGHPHLFTVGGHPPEFDTSYKGRVSNRVVDSHGGLPIYETVWDVGYIVNVSKTGSRGQLAYQIESHGAPIVVPVVEDSRVLGTTGHRAQDVYYQRRP